MMRFQKGFVGLLMVYIMGMDVLFAQSCIVKNDVSYQKIFQMINTSSEQEVKKTVLANPDLKEAALFAAVSKGNASLVSWLIQEGVKLDCQLEVDAKLRQFMVGILFLGFVKDNGKAYVNIVPMAYDRGYTKLVEHLVIAGAEPLIFYDALEKNDDEMVAFLMAHGEDINKKNEYSDGPLLRACDENKAWLVHKLLDMGADVTITGKFDKPPIAYTIERENIELTRLLLEKGASLQSSFFFDPVKRPLRSKNMELLKLLLENGADPNASSEEAACTGDPEVVKLFIEYKADFNFSEGVDEKCLQNPAVHVMLKEYGVLSRKEYQAAKKRGFELYYDYCRNHKSTAKISHYLDSPLVFDKKWGKTKEIMHESAKRGDTSMVNIMVTKYKQLIPFQIDFHNTESLFKIAIDHKQFDYVVFLIRMSPDLQAQKKLIERCIAYSRESGNKKMLRQFSSL